MADTTGVRAQPVHRLGLEPDVGVDPHELLDARGERVGRPLPPGLIDRRVAADPPDRLVAPRELPEGPVTVGLDLVGDRDEDHALGVVRHERQTSRAVFRSRETVAPGSWPCLPLPQDHPEHASPAAGGVVPFVQSAAVQHQTKWPAPLYKEAPS